VIADEDMLYPSVPRKIASLRLVKGS
jgi:hypothetical protein